MFAESRTILAVDQDPGTRILLEITLNAEGYQTTVVGDPDTAFDLLDQWLPAIVLFDEETFGPTVVDFVAHAKALDPRPDLILVSRRVEAAAMAHRLGIQRSLVKPFDPTRLFKIVTECPRFTAGGTQIIPAVASRRGPNPANARRPLGNGTQLKKSINE